MAGRRLVLDGYNLMFRGDAPRSASLQDAREAFLVRVAASRVAGDRVTVVFDGVIGAGSSPPGIDGVRIVYSRPPRTADDVIVRMVEKAPRRQTTVLTWDRELRHRVKSAGGVVGDPAAFLAEPRPGRRRVSRPRGPAAGKPKPPRGTELDEWERLFREGRDDAPPRTDG